MATAAGALTLPDVAREFPQWACWQAISGMYLARHREALPDAGCEIRGGAMTPATCATSSPAPKY